MKRRLPPHTPLFAVAFTVMVTSSVALAEQRMTRFDPNQHAFKFSNSFTTVTGVADVAADGLCGGMSYAALDYFLAGMAIPPQAHQPAPGTQLEGYIRGRHFDSFKVHLDKWAELHANPGGIRNDEFFRWGLEMGRGRLKELRDHIDRGQPVPLGLKSLTGDPFKDHVVLAIGYDVGNYKGDMGANQQDVRIMIYDPSGIGKKLYPDAAKKQWCYEGGAMCWRAYFVQTNYRSKRPPDIGTQVSQMVVEIETGNDDLRGGNDNASIEVALADGRTVTSSNINRSQRWIDRSTNRVGIDLPNGTTREMVRNITLKTNFRGGMSGDNWNVNAITVKFTAGSNLDKGCKKSGSPLVRFTGDRRDYTMPAVCD